MEDMCIYLNVRPVWNDKKESRSATDSENVSK